VVFASVCALVLLASACGTRLASNQFTSGPLEGSSSPGTSPGTAPTASSKAIRVGLIVSKTSPLGPETFSGPMYGALAFFDDLNAHGGMNGRKVQVFVCDDQGSGSGNQACVHQLIDSDHVIAFAGNSIFSYAGASYVNAKRIPDVGGYPFSTAYDTYKQLYSITGSTVPRDGTLGFDGKVYGGTEVFHWAKVKLGVHVAAVVYYNQAESQRYANYLAKGLAVEGYQVVLEQVDFALPNFDSVVLDMKSRGVDSVFDAMDTTGNQALCSALDSAHVPIRAKVTNEQNFSGTAGSDYASSATCRDHLYATSTAHSYEDTKYPSVAAFRKAMATYYPDREKRLSQLEVEGFASAQWLTDAMRSCGSNITSTCIDAFMNRPVLYDAHGLIVPEDFVVSQHPGGMAHNCLTVGQWQDGTAGGKGGGWVTRSADPFDCFTVPSVAYSP
jgi:branched-chain amino acid transport system substrate-binding protein